MARPALLPLPDDQARAVMLGVQDIEQAIGTTARNREFLKHFVPHVHRTTGQIFGASTFLRLLKQFAPSRSPSSDTVLSEVTAYRNTMAAAGDIPARPLTAVMHAALAAASSEEWQRLKELMAYQKMELAQAREREQAAATQAAKADHAREQALIDAAAARAELRAAIDLANSRQETIQQLADALQVANSRSAADNRIALQRVDEIRSETRQVQEQLRIAHLALQTKDKELNQIRVLADSLRGKVSQLRNDHDGK